MCNSIFIGCFCIVFHCNTYKLYRPFSIQIVIHIGLFVKHWWNSCWRPPITWNYHACLFSQCFKPKCSVQVKNIFLPCGCTRVVYRNTLLNDSDDYCFVSLNLLSLSILLCFFLCSTFDVIRKMGETIRMQVLVYFISLFYHFNKFKMASWVSAAFN